MRSSVVNDVVEKARGLLGTPWHHQGRLPGFGIDCIGIVVCIAHARDYFSYDETNYGRDPTDDRLERGLERFFKRIDGPPAPGCVLLFEHPETKRQHLGIATENGMIHAQYHLGKGKVVEQPIGDKWMHSLKGVYEWAR